MDLGASPLLLSKEDRLGWVHLASCATRAEQHWKWQSPGWGGFQAGAAAPYSLTFSERRKFKGFVGNLNSQALIRSAPQVPVYHKKVVPAVEWFSFLIIYFSKFCFWGKEEQQWMDDTQDTALKASLFLRSLVAHWHAPFRFGLDFQLLAGNCCFQWQVPRQPANIAERVIFLLEDRGRERIVGSCISFSWIYWTEVNCDTGLCLLLGLNSQKYSLGQYASLQ